MTGQLENITQIETVMWEKSSNSKNMKGNNKFEIKTKSGSRFNRNDVPPQLNYQMFLTEEDHAKVLNTLKLKGMSWTKYGNSIVHFYGGCYIWSTSTDFFKATCGVLNIKAVW